MSLTDLAIGVDVGGTKIAAGVVDDQGHILDQVRVPTPSGSADAVEAGIVEAVRVLRHRAVIVAAARAGRAVAGVGVAVAGFVDEKCALVRFAANLPIVDRPMKANLEPLTGLPVVIENDAKAAAWGEFRFGGGQGGTTMILLTVGTGLGSGFVLDSRLYRGAFGTAPEFGHVRRVPGGHPCGCGGQGCWEQYVSGSALVRIARERARDGQGWPAVLEDRAGGDPEAITGPMVTEAAQLGDPIARELLAEIGWHLGEGIADLANLLDPATVVVGGGLCDAGDLLLDPARHAYEKALTGASQRPRLRIVRAELGNDAGLIGAADVARIHAQQLQGAQLMGAELPLAVGVDIGGTKVAAGVVDERGRVIDRERRLTPSKTKDARAVEETIVEVVESLRTRHDIASVGIGAAGFVDSARSHVLFAPHLAWRNEPLRDAIAGALHLPVVVENDANAAAWAEWRFGAGQGQDVLVCVTLGTGIGGGIVIDGVVQRGRYGMAGEFGHMIVVPDGRRCECGNRGCLEQYASGNVLGREARELARAGSPVSVPLLELVGGEIEALVGPSITEAAQAGEALAIELFEEVGRWLGIGLANLAAALDPGMFVIGGGVSDAGELLLRPARESFRRVLTGRGFRPEPRIVKAALGPEAGLVGAADLSRVG